VCLFADLIVKEKKLINIGKMPHDSFCSDPQMKYNKEWIIYNVAPPGEYSRAIIPLLSLYYILLY
jgi:hypothetical protein